MSAQSHDAALADRPLRPRRADRRRAGRLREAPARCPSCAEEVRGLRETATRLAMATAVTPPPEMRDRVLAARRAPGSCRRPARARSPGGPRRAAAPRCRGRAHRGRPGAGGRRRGPARDPGSTSHQLRQAQARNRAIAAVLAAPDARIESVPAAQGGTVTAVMSLRKREAVVTTADLPALPGARVYQLWVMTAAGARPVGGPARGRQRRLADARTRRRGAARRPARHHRRAAGGTAQPTTTPVVIMPVR